MYTKWCALYILSYRSEFSKVHYYSFSLDNARANSRSFSFVRLSSRLVFFRLCENFFFWYNFFRSEHFEKAGYKIHQRYNFLYRKMGTNVKNRSYYLGAMSDIHKKQKQKRKSIHIFL